MTFTRKQMRNFWHSLIGRPLPVDQAMMSLSNDLKVTVAGMTTRAQREVLEARFPHADLSEAFSVTPPKRGGGRVVAVQELQRQAQG